MSKKFSLLTAGIIALFSACSDNIVESSPDSLGDAPIETSAKLNVLVRDISTGSPLVASVKLLSTGESATTDASGTAIFKDIYVGTHSLLVEKDDYASAVYETQITGQSDQNIFIANDASELVGLYPLTAGLDGYLFYANNKTGAVLPASGAKVRIELYDDRFVQKIFEATADANGKYVFSGLPAVGYSYRIWALEHAFAGVTYGTTPIEEEYLVPGSVAHATTPGTYSSDVSLFAFLGYNSVVNPTDTVKFEFSDTIDVQKVSNSTVKVYDNNYNDIVADVIYKGKDVLIVPAGKWSEPFRVIFEDLTSVKGKTISSVSRSVTLILEDLSEIKVAGLANKDSYGIDSDSYEVDLLWNKVAGATGYRVFAKASGGSNKESFVRVTSATGTTDTTITINLNDYTSGLGVSSNQFFTDKGEVEFIVQAYNNYSQTLLNGATAIKVFDRGKPTSINMRVSSDSTVYFEIHIGNGSSFFPLTPSEFGVNYLSELYGAAASEIELLVYFSEPMDTTTAIAPSFSPSVSRLTVAKKEWYSESELILTVKIAAGTALTANVNSICSISGLKDKRGNAFEIKYTSPVTTKSTLDFRFIANAPVVPPPEPPEPPDPPGEDDE